MTDAFVTKHARHLPAG